ncbi:sensor histidine kinase [Microbispora bryophytorum]|uniref:histidine kinase n=1 Tax=Microbispora bryophytorum subsp. camponoti TaxID=1677852 RepID=A0ABR8L2Y8_9ACTN|nr:HAMP domain-containing sensor histidine kinase [Microbispora camponoti]MBD3144611.1 HAMP domain-containing histidine kinase [Microbispora camponoti]
MTDKLLILVWPLFALLTSVAAAKGLVHVLTGRSSSVTWHALLTSDRTDRAKASRVEGGEHGPGRRVPRRPLKADRPQHRPSATGSAGHASAEHAHAHAHETSGPAGASPPDSMRRENGHRRPDRRRPGLRGPGLWARLAPRSIRGQMTLLVTIMTVFTLLPEGGGMYLLARAGTVGRRWDPCGTAVTGAESRLPAHGHVRHAVQQGAVRPVQQGAVQQGAVRGGAGGVRRVAGLMAAGPAGSSPPAAWGTPPRAFSGDLEPRTGTPRPTPACRAVFPAGSRVVVEAGQPLLGLTPPGSLPLLVALETAELVALNAWVTWKVSKRLLRPLDAVGAELSRIDFGHLAAGISVPRRAQEITRLGRTINQALGRVRKAKEELEEFARRQRQFASDVAHELRTPIAGLRVQLEAAQQDPGEVPLPELLETLLDQVDRLQTITEDILSIARMPNCPPAEWRQLDLAALVKAEIARRADRHPVRLRITHGATVTAVPSQISRLLANLLNNAQRHSRRVVCVEVQAEPTAVELAVSDDGPGIAEADREQVFQRFTRLDDARRLDRHGTGLGLAIARDIAQAHQGTLRVEESTAGGARFVLRLPRVRPTETGSS